MKFFSVSSVKLSSINLPAIKKHLLKYLFWYMFFISIALHSFVLFFDFSTSGPSLNTSYTELSLMNVNEMKMPEQKITEVKEVSAKRDENLVEENNTSTSPDEGRNFLPFYMATRMPALLKPLTIEYPEGYEKLGIEGVVILQIDIDKFGKVRYIKVLSSLGDAFDKAAKKAVMAAHFTPAYIQGEPIPIRMTLPIRFVLE